MRKALVDVGVKLAPAERRSAAADKAAHDTEKLARREESVQRLLLAIAWRGQRMPVPLRLRSRRWHGVCEASGAWRGCGAAWRMARAARAMEACVARLW